MGDYQKWFDEFYALGMHNPDLLALIIGSLAGFALTIVLELYFLPTTTDPDRKRRQKGYTFLFCWFASTVASALFWLAIDTADSAYVRWTICAIVSVFGFFCYPVLARYLTAKFPAIGTAWDGITKGP